jgi:DNA-3-methyladenine glycosylase I
VPKQSTLYRCAWSGNNPLIRVHDDRTLFELLVLEGAQGGLSWQTVLDKRAQYRKAFNGFDPKKVAR